MSLFEAKTLLAIMRLKSVAVKSSFFVNINFSFAWRKKEGPLVQFNLEAIQKFVESGEQLHYT